MSNSVTFDRHMMAIALAMARRGLGRTAPNPSVGAVIADEATGTVIARAVTAPGGRPHAETIALEAAGEAARGATLYVTLEPCSHVGRTAPCADAVIAAGLRRVVVAILDPDPRVAGRGLARLRDAGIAVEKGLLAKEAYALTRGHIFRTTERRPLVTIKLALNSEGHLARGSGGKPVFVTGVEARARGHLLRSQNDAILVGSQTVRDDNPDLTCRLPGLEERSPVRVVLSRTLDIPLDCRLLSTARHVPVWVVGGYNAVAERQARIEATGAHVVRVSEVAGQLWLPSVMEALVERGITRLLVEGGPHIWRSFAAAGLADDVELFMAGHSANLAMESLERFLPGLSMKLDATAALGPDTLYSIVNEAGLVPGFGR